MFCTEVKEYIAACHPPNDAFGEDVCLWQATDNGKFTVKSAYNSIVKNDSLHDFNGWKEIWENFLPPRIKHFLWLVKHRKILTNCERVRRRMTDDAKTHLHALRDCRAAAKVWKKILFVDDVPSFFGKEMNVWMSANLRGEYRMGVGRIETSTIVEDIVRAAECFTVNLCDTNKNMNVARNFRGSSTKWRPSNSGWIKINTDEAANTNGSWSAVGGFQRFIGKRSAVNVELWAILHGLEMAQSRGYDKVILETDCMTTVEIIKEGLRSTTTMTIIRKIKMMQRQFADVKFQFVRKEWNMVADWLARNCSSNAESLIKIEFPSFHVKKLVLEDKLGDDIVRTN
ncbi:hypothetical protein CXB51_020358 [Gossypium anomalum]|uniref:RNase H type-1 domain-containing protein n=1 Tax=Gossypium anomalum TaxID=47600 RepID=A0A8J5YCW0_9ROSI|nr:hypothetical protein CXB51_020358 [Gossypium anomalum]